MMNKVQILFLLFCFITNEVIGQNAKIYPYGEKDCLEITPVQGQVNEKGKPLKSKTFKKETGIINGMKIVNYGGINWIYEHISKNDYSGIQGFPGISKPNKDFRLSGTVNLPDVVVIDYYYNSFFSGTDIEKVVFSPYIKKIGHNAFYNCKKLTEIVFPEGCGDVEIEKNAFPVKYGTWGEITTNINKIIVPKGRIEEFAKKVNLPEEFFDDGTCTLELDIKVEKSGTILDKLPVDKLKQIKSLSIVGILDENDLEVIKSCKNLKSLDLSQCYTTLSEEAQTKRKANQDFLLGMFQAMGKVSEEKYKNGEISYTDNLQTQLFVELTKGTDHVKNACVGCIIPAGAFSNMKDLETVILPYRAITIESYAFEGCLSLKSVQLPKYIESICKGAFENCKNLKEIIIPPTLSSCHYEAFDGCKSLTKLDFSKCRFSSKDGYCIYKGCENLKEIRLPEGIEILSKVNRVLSVYYMPKTITRFDDAIFNSVIYFQGENPPKVETLDHRYKPKNCVIYVPKGCMTKYYATFNGDGNTLKEE